MGFQKHRSIIFLAASFLLTNAALSQPTPVRVLDNAPLPVNFINPGVNGVYATLRTQVPVASRVTLAKYVPYGKLDTPPDAKRFQIQQVVVKFVEGSAIRMGDSALILSTDKDALAAQKARLGRSGLEPADVKRIFDQFNALLKKNVARIGRGAPQIAEADLTRLSQQAETNSGAEQADLNLFYFIYLQKPTAEQAQAFLNDLRALKIVETAYFQPIPFDAADIPPITTIDVTNSQGYFMPAPLGIDVNFARRFAGGLGGAVKIADIESGWDTEHEDLPAMSFGFGTNWGGEHGTAVMGELVAQANGYGATGIAPNALIGWSSTTNLDPFNGGVYFYSVAGALLTAAQALQKGDLALIEQHFANLFAGACPNTCNCGQFGYVAVETIPFEHAAISTLTGSGIVVVEAAGNGQTLVTPASTRDSGAIVVGASDSGGAGVPECFTNFGPRVNVRAWGDSVGSIGFGDDNTLKANGNDNRQWYTRTFSGTSSATPIVTGAAALIQSTRDAVGLPKLTSVQMRTLLVSTGVPQSTGVAIGPQPNLRAAIATYIPDLAMFVSQTSAPATVSPGASFFVSETFQNSGGAAWTGDHKMAISAGSGTAVWQSPTATLGTSAGPVMPGDNVVKGFTVVSPTATGTYRLVFAVTNSAAQILATSPAQTVVVATANTAFDNASITISAPGSLPSGGTGTVTATVTNTGTTTWNSTYSLSLSRLNRISLPVNTVPLTTTVPPNGSVTLHFSIICNGSGLGGFSVQMSGNSGTFGQSTGQNVSCQ